MADRGLKQTWFGNFNYVSSQPKIRGRQNVAKVFGATSSEGLLVSRVDSCRVETEWLLMLGGCRVYTLLDTFFQCLPVPCPAVKVAGWCCSVNDAQRDSLIAWVDALCRDEWHLDPRHVLRVSFRVSTVPRCTRALYACCRYNSIPWFMAPSRDRRRLSPSNIPWDDSKVVLLLFGKNNKWSKNSDKRPHRMSCCYWGLNDPICCVHHSRDSQCFSMG